MADFCQSGLTSTVPPAGDQELWRSLHTNLNRKQARLVLRVLLYSSVVTLAASHWCNPPFSSERSFLSAKRLKWRKIQCFSIRFLKANHSLKHLGPLVLDSQASPAPSFVPTLRSTPQLPATGDWSPVRSKECALPHR